MAETDGEKVVKHYDIVISYASDADESVCLRMREELVERGYSVFMDIFRQYPKQSVINTIIHNAHFFIACLTQRYMTEKSRERDLALNLETDPKRKLTIQVAFLDNILDRNNTDVKYLHAGRGIYADFADARKTFEEAFKVIDNALNSKSQRVKYCIPRDGKWRNFNASLMQLFGKKETSVMISYCWKPEATGELCRRIKDRLIGEGYSVWIDVDKMAGNIENAAAEGVTNSCCFIACLSASYAESNECGKELSFASKLWREKEIHLLPLFVGSSLDEKNGDSDNAFDMNAFVAERVEKNDNDPDWIDLDKVQRVDFAKHDFETAFAKLLRVLESYQVPKEPSKFEFKAINYDAEEREERSSVSSFSCKSGSTASRQRKVEHDAVSVVSGISYAHSEYGRDTCLSSKLSSISISNVITATRNWPDFDISSERITEILVLPDQSVILLAADKNQIMKYILNSKGKYEVKLKSVKGFTTQPISICRRQSNHVHPNELVVLERTKELATVLFTCSDVFGDKTYLGALRETSFTVRSNPATGLLYLGMSAGNVLEFDLSKCSDKSSKDELNFTRTITVAGVPNVNLLVHDQNGFFVYIADNCSKIIVVYDLEKDHIVQKIDLVLPPNDLLVDDSDNLITLLRSNIFEVYSALDDSKQFKLEQTRSQKLKDIPQENFFLRHLGFINPTNSPYPSVLVCTGHGKTSKIDYAASSQC